MIASLDADRSFVGRKTMHGRMDDVQIIYLDNHLLVVNKPAGMLTQGDATGDLDLHSYAKQFLKERFNKPGKVFLGLVHRLDRPVSGVMVFARTSKAASRLTRQFKVRSVEKRYLALVEGRLTGKATLVDYVWKDHRRVRVVSESHPHAMRAELTYRSLAVDQHLSLVEIQLATGRPHQIRVQLARLGHAILGDFKYGSSRKMDGRNLALHSYALSVDHPTKGMRLRWEQPPPDSWGSLFEEVIAALFEQSK